MFGGSGDGGGLRGLMGRRRFAGERERVRVVMEGGGRCLRFRRLWRVWLWWRGWYSGSGWRLGRLIEDVLSSFSPPPFLKEEMERGNGHEKRKIGEGSFQSSSYVGWGFVTERGVSAELPLLPESRMDAMDASLITRREYLGGAH